ASQLGKGYSWAELQNKIDYQAERDSAFLFKLTASASESPNKAITPEITAEGATATLLLETGAKGSIAIGELK
ncbi:hypothetical protein QIG20_28145, partial [Klebsiella pneumoniae]|nr:hypothetical protein [Klebsiella pneumoniae]